MDRLPLEICYQIAAYLTCSEKQNLSLLSRQWRQLIRNHNMFTHFTIQGKKNFDAAILYFQQHEALRHQVQSLRLLNTEAGSFQVSSIPHQFPSLKDFSWINQQPNLSYRPLDREHMQFWNQITTYEEVNRFPLFQSILNAGGFADLTKLTLRYNGDIYFLSQLIKLKKIKYADLTDCSMSVGCLDRLHKAWPMLETLHLSRFYSSNECGRDTREQRYRDEEDWIATPAKRLKYLKIRDGIAEELPHHRFERLKGLPSVFFTYFANKYRNLMHLTIEDTRSATSRHRRNEDRLVDIANAMSHLETYNVNITPITSAIAQSFDGSDAQLQHVYLYNDPIPQLACLRMSLQEHSIHTITLTTNDVDRITYAALSYMSNLQHLTIDSVSGNTTIHFDDLLYQLKPLISLTITNCKIEPIADTRAVETSFRSRLKTLVLKDVTFLSVPCSNEDQSNNSMSLIARRCPALSRLSIDGKTQDPTKLFKVEFPHFRLTTVHINITNMEYYKKQNGKDTAWYKRDETGELVSCNEMSDLTDKAYVSIVYEGY